MKVAEPWTQNPKYIQHFTYFLKNSQKRRKGQDIFFFFKKKKKTFLDTKRLFISLADPQQQKDCQETRRQEYHYLKIQKKGQILATRGIDSHEHLIY